MSQHFPHVSATGGDPVLANQYRERIPERTAHAVSSAAGACGRLTIIRDFTKSSRAASR